jgi:hypothetical protein
MSNQQPNKDCLDAVIFSGPLRCELAVPIIINHSSDVRWVAAPCLILVRNGPYLVATNHPSENRTSPGFHISSQGQSIHQALHQPSRSVVLRQVLYSPPAVAIEKGKEKRTRTKNIQDLCLPPLDRSGPITVFLVFFSLHKRNFDEGRPTRPGNAS